jgi:septal ring factor EnvC (AmiA/AmiB activator)
MHGRGAGGYSVRSHTAKGVDMVKRTALLVVVMMCVLVSAGLAEGQDKVQKYFNDAACKVKAATDPSQKRAILENKIEDMSKALGTVRNSRLVSQADRAGLDRLNASLQEKRDELAGTNGYARVADDQLNAFSDYVVQDMEQADKTITVSVVTVLLIVIIIILVT